MTIWNNGLPKGRSSPCPPLPSKGTPTARRTRSPVPMPRNSRANMRTGSSPAASGIICRRKPRTPSLKRSSKPPKIDRPFGDIMTTATPAVSCEPELIGQIVVVIGGSAGIGLETARRARAEGASVILTGRNPERLKQAALEIDSQRTTAFDANDSASLQSFFQELPTPIDHVMVTAGAPRYAPPLEMPPEEARRGLTEHLLLALEVARGAADKVRPPGSLIFMGGTGARRPRVGLAIASTATVAFPTLIANLALELAPIRVNLIAAGFVDTPLSASILGDELDKRRDELRATLPIRRVVGPADIAALAVHIMSNTAVTGATYDIDGGQQLVS